MRNNFVLILILSLQTIAAQMPQVPFEIPAFSFIQYQSNQFELIHDNPDYINLFASFDTLVATGSNQIKIVHIGGSHIQADIYTHRIRQELQSFYPGMLGSRGFFFPYKIAQTNSPSNLWIQYTGEWLTCKNTQPEPLFVMGVSGITSELTSTEGSIKVVASFDTLQHYDFNRIRLFCNVTSTDDIPEIYPARLVKKSSVNPTGRYIQYDLTGYTDTLNLIIRQHDTLNTFQLYGISMETDDPGVIYTAIGVNGAMLKSYLRCGLFTNQLEALDPDWVIISIGTNEGNTRTFDGALYHNEYIRLLDSVELAVPDAAILLTVPNDSYLNKRYINHNTNLIREIILDIARQRGYGVWDFYTIMGGLNSAKSWYDSGLMNKDHIHFNKPGYYLKGDLFYAAFLRSWNDPSFTHSYTLPVQTQTQTQTLNPAPAYPITNHQSPVTILP